MSVFVDVLQWLSCIIRRVNALGGTLLLFNHHFVNLLYVSFAFYGV